MDQSKTEKVTIIMDLLQNALQNAQEYDGYRNEREEDALVSAIQRAIWSANIQLR